MTQQPLARSVEAAVVFAGAIGLSGHANGRHEHQRGTQSARFLPCGEQLPQLFTGSGRALGITDRVLGRNHRRKDIGQRRGDELGLLARSHDARQAEIALALHHLEHAARARVVDARSHGPGLFRIPAHRIEHRPGLGAALERDQRTQMRVFEDRAIAGRVCIGRLLRHRARSADRLQRFLVLAEEQIALSDVAEQDP